ncbi:D-galactonate transporter [Abditibacteriota bacterium]|nr:D-galactonate transporter [Abditibacteriota bacterium]
MTTLEAPRHMTPTPPSAPRRAVNPWTVVALLWPVALLNYFDRQMLSTMKLSMQADIPALQSAEHFGQLMAIFLWVYAFCSPLSGMLADRLNRKWLIVGSLGVWSTVTLLMGFTNDFNHLYILRGLMGISEAAYIPAGLALITDYHRGPTRSLAVGIHMTGIYTGAALGGAGGWLAQTLSWHKAFFLLGVVGVVYAFVLLVFLREKRSGEGENETSTVITAKSEPPVQWLSFGLLLLCFALPSMAGWGVKNWLPTLLQDRFALNEAQSGLWATISTQAASFAGVILGARFADIRASRTIRGRTQTSALGLFLMVPALVGLGLAPGLALTILAAMLFGFGIGVIDANNMPILCQIAPPRFRATGYGLMNFFGIAAGAYLTPLLGRLKDGGVPLSLCFALCAIPTLLAVALMLLLRPRDMDDSLLADGALANLAAEAPLADPQSN